MTVALIASVTVAGCDAPLGRGGSPPPVTTLNHMTYYPDCDAVHDADVEPLRRGDAGYRPPLDRDGDGVACDEPSDEEN